MIFHKSFNFNEIEPVEIVSISKINDYLYKFDLLLKGVHRKSSEKYLVDVNHNSLEGKDINDVISDAVYFTPVKFSVFYYVHSFRHFTELKSTSNNLLSLKVDTSDNISLNIYFNDLECKIPNDNYKLRVSNNKSTLNKSGKTTLDKQDHSFRFNVPVNIGYEVCNSKAHCGQPEPNKCISTL
jgi:hypothetical protein